MSVVVHNNYQTWLICGGRDFADAAMFQAAMSDLIQLRGVPSRVVHGDARGADALAGRWAGHMAAQEIKAPADWTKHGKAAGAIRNQEMLDRHKPVFVVAFPGGRGTADMVRRARKAGIDVAEIKPQEDEKKGEG